MKRGILLILFLLSMISLTPTASDAITVTISFTPTGGTMTQLDSYSVDTTGNTTACLSLTTKALVNCSLTSTTPNSITYQLSGVNVVTIWNCMTVPPTGVPNCGTNSVARVYKNDGASSDSLAIKGAVVMSQAAGTLVIDAQTSCTTTSNGKTCEYASVSSGSYPYTAGFTGSFQKTATTATPPGSCNTTTFCAEYKLLANGNTVNSSGSTTLATISVPPISISGSFFPPTETSYITCLPDGTTCYDQLETVLTVVFDAANEVLRLPGSAKSFAGNVTAENDGVFFVNQDPECAGCVSTQNGFLAYGLSADFLATCSGAQCNKTSSKSGSSSFQLQWELSIPQTLVQTPIQLVAVDPGLTTPTCTAGQTSCIIGLSAAVNQPTSRAFLLFLPPPMPSSGCSSNDPNCLFLDNLGTLEFDNSSVTTGTTAPCTAPGIPKGCGLQVDGLFIDINGDGQADPVTFGDCANGSFFALVRVFDPKTNLPGSLKIFLGNNSNLFQDTCTLQANTNLISLADARVEVNVNTSATGTGPIQCTVGTATTTACFSWADALKNFSNKTVVNSISLEADAKVAATNQTDPNIHSQLVVINSATIASTSKSNGPCSGSPCVFSPTKATNFQLACSADLLPDPANILIKITKVSGTNGLGAAKYVPVSAPTGCNYQVIFTPTGNLVPDNNVTNIYELQFLVNGIAKPTPALLTINQ